MWYRTEFDFNVLFIHLRTRKMPFNALVFTLRSKVELNWTRAIRHVIAQSVQFSKIAKKLNIDLCNFFLTKRKHCPYQNHEIKNGGHRTRFCRSAAESSHHTHFSDFWESTGARFKMACVWKGKESNKKSVFTEFTSRYQKTQCDKESV